MGTSGTRSPGGKVLPKQLPYGVYLEQDKIMGAGKTERAYVLLGSGF